MNTKLKIQINDSSLEVEGDEDFVKMIYEDFKDHLNTTRSTIKKTNSNKKSQESKSSSSKTKNSSNGKKSNKKGDDLNLINDLDLYPDDNWSLKDFINQYDKPSKSDKYLLYVYYLKEILKIEKVTVDHIYTCIKDIGDKTPMYLSQTLHNLKREKGWIDTADIDDINYTIPGENHIDHVMKKVESLDEN